MINNSVVKNKVVSGCDFCQIVEGKTSAKIIYENESVICFLSKKSEVYGHTLIVPKKHYVNFYDIPTETLCELIKAVQKLTIEYKKKIDATGMNLMHASGKDGQQSVFHFHFHLLPRFKDDGLDTWPNLKEKNFNNEEIWKKIKTTS
jgi:histidine triad (HIT) family protein